MTLEWTKQYFPKILNFYYPIKLNHHLNKDGHCAVCAAVNVYRCPFMLSVLKDNLFYSKDLLKNVKQLYCIFSTIKPNPSKLAAVVKEKPKFKRKYQVYQKINLGLLPFFRITLREHQIFR